MANLPKSCEKTMGRNAKKSPPTVRPEGIEQKVGNAPRYSAIRISRILMAAVAIGVPGPKMAAAPSR